MKSKRCARVPGYLEYIITIDGRIYSIRQLGRPRKDGKNQKKFKKLSVKDNNGYFYIKLRGEKNIRMPIHRIMAMTFLSEFKTDLDVHHIDGDRKNNKINNLKCLSFRDHHELHGWNKGEKNKNSKLKISQVLKIKKDLRKNEIIAKEYGVTRQLINMIKKNLLWGQKKFAINH